MSTSSLNIPIPLPCTDSVSYPSNTAACMAMGPPLAVYLSPLEKLSAEFGLSNKI